MCVGEPRWLWLLPAGSPPSCDNKPLIEVGSILHNIQVVSSYVVARAIDSYALVDAGSYLELQLLPPSRFNFWLEA